MGDSGARIRLAASVWMNDREGKEADRIRIPRRSRASFDTKGSRVVIKTDKATLALETRQARKEDLAVLRKQVSSGEITKEQSKITAFVCTKTLNKLVGRRRKNLEDFCWVSDDIEALLIGADPEFCLVGPNGGYKYASHVKGFTAAGNLGHDGPLAEVRPPPAPTIPGIISNISGILKKGDPSISNYGWVGGATYSNANNANGRTPSMGGHIHCGDSALMPKKNTTGVYQRVIQVLDETIALPLVRIDTPDPYLRRNTKYMGYGNYGRWGDTRPQVGRFEWRVPSGIWLVHPEIAQAVLGATKAVTEASYQLMAEKGFDFEWIAAPRSSTGFLKKWGAMDEKRAEKIINESKSQAATPALIARATKKLRALPNYDQYKGEIESFIDIVNLSAKDRKNLSLDIRENWVNGGSLIRKG